jgi:hypothetical protein
MCYKQVQMLPLVLCAAALYGLVELIPTAWWFPAESLTTLITRISNKAAFADGGTVIVWCNQTRRLSITADCLYWDLITLGLACAALGTTEVYCCIRYFVGFFCAVVVVNTFRIVLCMYLYSRGYSWFVAHDLWDIALWYGILCVALQKAVRPQRCFVPILCACILVEVIAKLLQG